MGGLGYAPVGGLSKIVNAESIGDGTGGIHSTSLPFIDMAKLSAVTIPATAGDVLYMSLDGSFFADPAAPSYVMVAFAINGVTKTDAINSSKGVNTIDWPIPLSLSRLYTVQAGDIVSGLVTVTAQWSVSASAYISNTAGDAVPVLKVMNLAH